MSDKKSPEVISDNSLNDAKFTMSATDLVMLGAKMASQASNQGNTQQSAIDTLLKNFVTSSRNDEDVNATEVIRSQNLAWPFNQKLIAAAELGKTIDGLIQGSQISANLINQQNLINTNAITQSNNANNALVKSIADSLTAMQKEIDTLLVQPYPYAEMAPASQDTGGEGDDTGDTDE